jgi:hypothetical protein
MRCPHLESGRCGSFLLTIVDFSIDVMDSFSGTLGTIYNNRRRRRDIERDLNVRG